MLQFKIKKSFTFYVKVFVTLGVYFLHFLNHINCLEAPQITLPGQGIIVGTYLKMFRAQNIKAYLGIRYARALRFSPPELDMSEWQGVLNATRFAPFCWQNPSNVKTTILHNLLRNKVAGDYDITYDEDCLNLNIFVPDGSPGVKGYAVIFWIHPGDFSHGSPIDIEPFQIVFKQKIIVVTFSYRLNIFGFLSTADGEAQGNFGLMDQSAALFWVKKNINHFGGNENKITIMGHSAGAVSVGLHLISEEWSKGGYSRAIMMSGNPITDKVVRDAKDYTEPLDSISTLFGCNRRPTSMLLTCLRKVDAKTLITNLPEVEWGPVIDYGLSNTSAHFIKDYPRKIFKEGNFQNVPILIGATNMEDIFNLVDDITNPKLKGDDFLHVVDEISKHDLKANTESDENCTNSQIIIDAVTYMYPTQGEGVNILKQLTNFHTDRMYIAPLFFMADVLGKGNKVFAYLFSVRPQTQFIDLPEWVGVPKFFDQIFVWGVPYMNNTSILREWNSSDKKIADVVMTMWANFAKSADPIISNVYVKWNSFKDENNTVLIINQNFNSEQVNNMLTVRFWNNYYPSLVKFAANCCEVANTAISIFVNNRHSITFSFNVGIISGLIVVNIFLMKYVGCVHVIC
ncbi:PREDICTED: cholinesterase [Bactrocera latifrons]|uniref:cholinesterase n=1 Tax=Bactrocera latifrons TaxID=174628 RepID=UPI0008DC6A5F|nr:PREDICTED: cholinesterase [Bactrocera latifrons]